MIPIEANCFDAPSDPITVMRAELADGMLHIEAGHSGGCAEHRYRLCPNPVVLRSDPAIQEIALVHDANGDSCEAFLTQTLSVPLTALPRWPVAVDAIQDRVIGLRVE